MEFTTLCWISGHLLQISSLLIWCIKLIWESYTSYYSNAFISTTSRNKSDNRVLIIFISIFSIFFFFFNLNSNYFNMYIYINTFISMELAIYWILLLIFLIILDKTYNGYNLYSVELTIMFSFLFIGGTLLLTASNLLYVFFLLELLGFLILYMMFILQVVNPTNLSQTTNTITISLIYQFILNFFGSIIFYFSIISLLFYYNTISVLSIFNNIFVTDKTFWTSLTLLALLIKFGTGPWICYKIKIYNNLSLFALGLYTLIYFSVLFIYFLNLLYIFNLTITFFLNILICLLMVIAILSFSTLLFQYNRITLFLGFSSLLNTTLFFFQIFISITYMFK